MATGDIIIVTKSNTNIHRQTLPVVSLLGYHNRPVAFESAWGNQNILGGGIVKMTANAQKKMKNKKAARASASSSTKSRSSRRNLSGEPARAVQPRPL